MKTEEKTSVDAVAQVIFRPSAERRGYYRFHYGYLVPDGSFSEALELNFSEFLGTTGVSAESVAAYFLESLSEPELEIFDFGYLSQECFDRFVRHFVGFCDAVQLYPGMLVLTFSKKENEG